ncbi:helix-turn-helix domain-containing protein [Clostridium sp.]|uniref:winged helix-turn-helix domain-containing protein n=1 Tax=Clostridium sp. TaxID=1506 RepID=UPI0026210E6E|nr:helix-turn-helix domain-containing protein [Clostridium sp.]
MNSVMNLTTLEQIKAYSDPYRLKIITYLRNNQESATVKEIADFFGEVPAKVHYHIKKLEKAGILELVKTKEIKGIIAKYYYLTAESFNIEGNQIKKEVKQVYKSQILNILSEYYDTSKEQTIKIISDKVDDGNAESSIGFNYKNIYLSDEEFVEFNKEIRDIVRKYEKKEEGKTPCHVFSVCLKNN